MQLQEEFQYGLQHYVPPTLLPSGTSTNDAASQLGQTGSTGSQSGINNNIYTTDQQGAQATALSQLSNALTSGGASISPQFGLPQAAYDAAIANWKQNAEPLFAAQNGAGSPAMGSSLSQLIQQLAGISGQNMIGNFQGIANQLGNFAFTPEGNKTAQANTAQGTSAQQNVGQSQTSAYNPGGAVDELMQILGTALQNLKF
jgi:hypothetical protein